LGSGRRIITDLGNSETLGSAARLACWSGAATGAGFSTCFGA
jgi:hypothetical protein